MKNSFINTLFIIFILISVVAIPLLMFLSPSFASIGVDHAFAVIVALFTIFIVSKNVTIKKYFSESYEYLFIGIVFLSGVHLIEYILEIVMDIKGEFGDILIEVLEHLFFYLGILAIAYSFFKIKEPSTIEGASENDEIK